jgi:hypothetical protein
VNVWPRPPPLRTLILSPASGSRYVGAIVHDCSCESTLAPSNGDADASIRNVALRTTMRRSALT